MDTHPTDLKIQRPPPPPEGCDIKELMRYNAECERLRMEAARKVRQAPTPQPPSANDVHAMLRENMRHEAERAINQAVDPKRAKDHRWRDFWLIVVLGNLSLVGLTILSGVNTISLVFCGAGIILITVSAIWVIFFLLDRY